MKDLETTYNKAMDMLSKGRSKEQVLLEFKENADQLSPLLDVSMSLFTLPKLQAPKPAMQRKYALAPSKNFLLAWIHISKFAGVSMSIMLLLSALTLTSYEAYHSGPGEVLFSVKKSAEQVQVLLAYNENDKASIQIAIAKQRLSEAQAIFNNPSSGVAQKKAALTELANQTSAAVAVVNDVTLSDPKSTQSPPLLNSLENINTQQRSLVAQIKPDAEIKDAAGSALASLNEDSLKISKIKHSVAVAASNQAIAQLSANPNSVAILGNITQITGWQITVEKTSFNIGSETSIKDSEGNVLKLSDLTLKTKVNVIGIQDKNNLVAQQILVTEDKTAVNSEPEVKGDSTQDATSSTGTEFTIKKPFDGKKTESGSSTGASIEPDPGTAVGTFIYEDPSPQFNGN